MKNAKTVVNPIVGAHAHLYQEFLLELLPITKMPNGYPRTAGGQVTKMKKADFRMQKMQHQRQRRDYFAPQIQTFCWRL